MCKDFESLKEKERILNHEKRKKVAFQVASVAKRDLKLFKMKYVIHETAHNCRED